MQYEAKSNVVRLAWAATLLLAAVQTTAIAGVVKQVVQRVMSSVVEIHILGEDGRPISSGSGIIVNRSGLVVTNYHVIAKATRARVVLADGEKIKVLGVRAVDADKDFAVLEIEASNLPAASLGDSDRLEAGDDLIAIGAPLGLPKTVTSGIVSQIRLDGYRVIQHTAAISPGSSGGPLLNDAGQVVGINSFLIKDGQSLFFALPINYVKFALDRLPKDATTLRELATAQEAIDAKQREAALADFLKANFRRYDDPDGLFQLVLPKTWQIERSVTRDQEGNVTVLFMASDPEAEQAKLNGWLSAGIRVRLVLPAKGRRYSEPIQLDWVKQYVAKSVKGYQAVKTAEPEQVSWGGRQALQLFMAGTSDKLSQPELTCLILAPGTDVLVAVEVTLPAQHKNLFEILFSILQKSFALNTGR